MPDFPRGTRVGIFAGGLAALVVGALAAAPASSALVSPMPSGAVAPAIVAWLGVAGGGVFALQAVALPRIVGRLLLIAVLAVGGWSIGTIARGLYVTVAFAREGAVEETATSCMILGVPPDASAESSLSANCLELRRSVSLRFDAAAAAAMTGHFTCVTLSLERTASGVARVRVPAAPLGVDDLDVCGAAAEGG